MAKPLQTAEAPKRIQTSDLQIPSNKLLKLLSISGAEGRN